MQRDDSGEFWVPQKRLRRKFTPPPVVGHGRAKHSRSKARAPRSEGRGRRGDQCIGTAQLDSKRKRVAKSRAAPRRNVRHGPGRQKAQLPSRGAGEPGEVAEGETLDLRDSDFDSSDLDAVLMSVGAQEGLEMSGQTTHRWSTRRRNRRKRRQKTNGSAATLGTAEGGSSSEENAAPRAKRVREPHCMATQEARILLARGQNDFAEGRFEAAIQSMRAAIREQPGLADPYHVLHLIYEETGDNKKSLDGLILAAYFTSPATEARGLWQKAAQLSQRLGLTDQACYALKRSISRRGHRDEDDLKSIWQLANLLIQKGSLDRGIELLHALYEETKDPSLACEVARKLVSRHKWKECLALLESCIKQGQEATPRRVDVNALNMLCEVLMEVRDFEKCAKILAEHLCLEPLLSQEKFDSRAVSARLCDSPVDLVAKLAAAHCRLHNSGSKCDDQGAEPGPESLCSCAMEVVLAHPPETHHDLHLLLVDALLAVEGTTAATVALRWPRRSDVGSWSGEQALRILDMLETWPGLQDDMRERRAMCLWRLGEIDKAALQLEALLEDSIEPDSRLRVRIAEAWIEYGDTERADQVLSNISYEDLQRSTIVPPALGGARRRVLYVELNDSIEGARDAAKKAGRLDKFHEFLGSQDDVRTFLQRFRHLVYDCELDYKRLTNYSSNAASHCKETKDDEDQMSGSELDETEPTVTPAATGEKSDTVTPGESCFSIVAVKPPSKRVRLPDDQIAQCPAVAYKMKRRHLGLESVEDMFGFEAYLTFVQRGIDVVRGYAFAHASKARMIQAAQAVELCEMILSNRRLVAMRNPIKRHLLRTLALKSLSLAFESRLWRVVFKHLRILCDREENNDIIALVSRILFTHSEVDFPATSSSSKTREDAVSWEQDKASHGHSASGHRATYASALTDVRSWAIRKLLRSPRSFGLTMLCSHFCGIASQYPFAVAEYSRAHRLAPDNPLVSLCLATSYVSFAMSRAAVYRHDLVLKGLTFLQRYQRLRRRDAGEQDEDHGENEPANNWGGPLQRRQSWEAAVPTDRLIRLAMRAETAYNYGRFFHQLSINNLAVESYESALELLEDICVPGDGDTQEPQQQLRTDLKAIRHSAAFNLASILRAQGAFSLASELLWRHVTF
eukprot:TRINITY_DN87149_c0_g1_i1.p1 TRINITY_DN87149_c0_g1~~TRINITY_DN87149_c0_g1_i1.p1  ORF type:complete len:1138 (-),score=179.40 TRINITY_DN87149_c0_g1_i1:59-3472(-)